MESPEADPAPVPSSANMSSKSKKAAVIGLYGVSGSGKSLFLTELKRQLSHGEFLFYEGSEAIASIVPGGLEAFQEHGKEQKERYRELAIEHIAETCSKLGKTAIVAGHFMFWSKKSKKRATRIYTTRDMEIYTHILYLEVPAPQIFEQRINDTQRHRPKLSVQALEAWQQAEVSELAVLCRSHHILFSRLSGCLVTQLMTAVKHIRFSTDVARQCATRVDAAVDSCLPNRVLETAVVVDADKTLSTDDTGVRFWEALGNKDCPLDDLFSSPLGYSETGMVQATLLYEEAANEENFERLCTAVASETKIHPEFASLFRLMESCPHAIAMVVTCGVRRIWEKILEREGFSPTVKVVGGGRISDGIVVTPEAKAQIVKRLQRKEQLHVVAMGDSPLDLPMLEAADEAIVITGEAETRSRSMDKLLRESIMDRGLSARQCLLPSSASPRLSNDVLPQMHLKDPSFLNLLQPLALLLPRHTFWHATDRKATSLLMSPMRNAANAGPMLRKAHEKVALYLAWEFLPAVLGVEEFPMQHVQGHQIGGYCLRHERRTTIVALMRGGEPMALGLSEALPLAMFVHARCASDVKREHLENQKTVILVDSVINSGKTLVSFIEHVRDLRVDISLVVVAGVVQADAISKGHAFAQAAQKHRVCVGALRLSDNKYVGSKGTDTGHRLFNTTHME